MLLKLQYSYKNLTFKKCREIKAWSQRKWHLGLFVCIKWWEPWWYPGLGRTDIRVSILKLYAWTCHISHHILTLTFLENKQNLASFHSSSQVYLSLQKIHEPSHHQALRVLLHSHSAICFHDQVVCLKDQSYELQRADAQNSTVHLCENIKFNARNWHKTWHKLREARKCHRLPYFI